MVSQLVKIEIDLPDWVLGSNIYIFAGRELVARKRCLITHDKNKHHVMNYQPLEVKTSRCNPEACKPFSCCTSSGISKRMIIEMLDALLEYNSDNPNCPLLTDQGCLMKGWIPFSCAKSVCTSYKGCTERVE